MQWIKPFLSSAWKQKHHALGADLDFAGDVGQCLVSQDDVALVAPTEFDIHALNQRDFGPCIGTLHYFKYEIHSLSLPNGWMLISWESSWKLSTGSS